MDSSLKIMYKLRSAKGHYLMLSSAFILMNEMKRKASWTQANTSPVVMPSQYVSTQSCHLCDE